MFQTKENIPINFIINGKLDISNYNLPKWQPAIQALLERPSQIHKINLFEKSFNFVAQDILNQLQTVHPYRVPPKIIKPIVTLFVSANPDVEDVYKRLQDVKNQSIQVSSSFD